MKIISVLCLRVVQANSRCPLPHCALWTAGPLCSSPRASFGSVQTIIGREAARFLLLDSSSSAALRVESSARELEQRVSCLHAHLPCVAARERYQGFTSSVLDSSRAVRPRPSGLRREVFSRLPPLVSVGCLAVRLVPPPVQRRRRQGLTTVVR